VVRAGNSAKLLDTLKQKGFWIYGVDERGEQVYADQNYAQPTVFVLGGEGHGLHQNVRNHCDILVRIPMAGAISSLNVSVASGIILFDWRRKAV
jgi:23S rRNA (guanosine2251-2'-O)-methyltransferase